MTTEIDITNTETSQATKSWYVIQQADGHCEIFRQAELTQNADTPKTWGPFTSRNEAISKRVGLIRAGKCLPK